ncbi:MULTISPECIES: hypothetical protein [Corynebacterium]|uniref:Uncharacterized protein n=1 Tax=Corynebacterium coyleae TaxID=53374 RepID=A0AAP6XKT2_9CORY|nr:MULTISPECIES: hypothetical protein [Corynebacterium]NJJ03128.1 hypothetical protein [Corynebacterium coyleae]
MSDKHTPEPENVKRSEALARLTKLPRVDTGQESVADAVRAERDSAALT